MISRALWPRPPRTTDTLNILNLIFFLFVLSECKVLFRCVPGELLIFNIYSIFWRKFVVSSNIINNLILKIISCLWLYFSQFYKTLNKSLSKGNLNMCLLLQIGKLCIARVPTRIPPLPHYTGFIHKTKQAEKIMRTFFVYTEDINVCPTTYWNITKFNYVSIDIIQRFVIDELDIKLTQKIP